MLKQFHLSLLITAFILSSMTLAEIPFTDGSEFEITGYKAQYDLRRDGKSVGRATRKLKQLDNNSWQLTMNSEARLMLLTFKYYQYSVFSWNNNKPRPDIYRQADKVTFKSAKVLNQFFNWQQMLEDGRYKKESWQLKLDPEIQDRQTSLLSLRLDLLLQGKTEQSQQNFSYPVSYKGKISDDVFQLITEETLKTPAGTFQTLKYEKTHKNRKRITYLWLAKELNYLPIRIQRIKDGEEQADMLLKSITPEEKRK